MENPDQLGELFRMQRALNQRIGVHTGTMTGDVLNACVKKNEVNFKRQDSGYTEKDHNDSKHI